MGGCHGLYVAHKYKGTLWGPMYETILYPTYSGGYTCVKSTVYTKNQSPFYSVNLESTVLRR